MTDKTKVDGAAEPVERLDHLIYMEDCAREIWSLMADYFTRWASKGPTLTRLEHEEMSIDKTKVMSQIIDILDKKVSRR